MVLEQPSEGTILRILAALNNAHKAYQTAKRRKDRDLAALTVTDCKNWFRNQNIPLWFQFDQYIVVPQEERETQ